MNQHKHLLYRQKYATCQLNNRTFSTQNTKISARSLAISYICFQVRIVKKKKRKKRGGGESHILSTTTENMASPAPPTPDKGAIREIATGETRNCNGRNYTFYHSWRPSWRPLFAENSRASGGSAPWAPGRALRRAPGPHPYEARAVRFAHTCGAQCARIFPPTPFLQILISHCTHPPCSSKSLQWKYCGGGGGKHIVLPPPPPIISSTWKNFNM